MAVISPMVILLLKRNSQVSFHSLLVTAMRVNLCLFSLTVVIVIS